MTDSSTVRLATLVVFGVLSTATVVRAGLRETMHNLSASGTARRAAQPGLATVPITGDSDLCGFCHTPHSAEGARGLWNRELEPVTYKLYESSTTEARMQQPTGSSRLCLSCHDGVTAMGAMKRRPDLSLGKLTGASVLGTDLSDDHPISFVYDQVLATRRRDLANPTTLIGGVRLDAGHQMQCTSCHDAHAERHPKFLVADPEYSALCVVCHKLPHWQESAHAASPATARAINALPGMGYATVGQNGCASCHTSHGAPHPRWLRTARTEEGVCLSCHDGRIAAKDVRRESLKYSAHRVDVYTDVHDPTENPATMAPHVECVDCHNSHEARAHAAGGQIAGPLAGVSGVTISGSFTREASFEYEVCLKCHGVTEDRSPIVYRVDNVTNVRLAIDTQNPSFHPVADVGKNSTISGLLPPLTPASRTPCAACHNNDAASLGGGSATRGPHGSNYRADPGCRVPPRCHDGLGDVSALRAVLRLPRPHHAAQPSQRGPAPAARRRGSRRKLRRLSRRARLAAERASDQLPEPRPHGKDRRHPVEFRPARLRVAGDEQRPLLPDLPRPRPQSRELSAERDADCSAISAVSCSSRWPALDHSGLADSYLRVLGELCGESAHSPVAPARKSEYG